jgi:hypothetical protein
MSSTMAAVMVIYFSEHSLFPTVAPIAKPMLDIHDPTSMVH